MICSVVLFIHGWIPSFLPNYVSERLNEKISSLQERHDNLEKMTIEEIWISECDELLKVLD